MIADDLFAGAGGWDLAAASLGIHARGVENMPEARATRDAAGLVTQHDDVWTFEPDGQASLLIASPPCQTFSTAGHGSGRKALDDVLAVLPNVADMTLAELREAGQAFGDDRTALVLTPLWFLLHNDTYRDAAWEQVPTVLPLWQACAIVLAEHGWNVVTGNLHAEQYGVAQTRKRAFLKASRDRAVSLPTPTHSKYHNRDPKRLDDGVLKWVSMAEAIGCATDDVMVSNYGTGGDPANRGTREGWQPAPTVTGKIDRNLVHPGPSWQLANNNTANAAVRPVDEPAGTIYFGQRSNYCAWSFASGTRRGASICTMDEPAVTLAFGHDAASFAFVPQGIAPEDIPAAKLSGEAVRITVPEACILQSFPPGHPIQGKKSKQYLQIGNAVPPLLARAVLATP